MLEDEVLSILLKAKELYKTHEATADALGVSRSTFHAWVKDGKGVKDQPLFKAMDKLGVHLVMNDEESPASKNSDGKINSYQNSLRTVENLKMDILKAKNEGLEEKIKALSAHNDTLQEQLRYVNFLLQEFIKKKDSFDTSLPKDATQKS